MAGKKTGKRLLTWVLVLVMALSLLPLNVLAAENGVPENTNPSIVKSEETRDAHLVKSATKEGDTYQIQLESWVTGKVTPTTESAPLDIVLVLDQSGSMAENGKLDSLKDAVKNFVETINADADKHDVEHRIAIVGFASNQTEGGSNWGEDGAWYNTGIFVNGTLKNYETYEGDWTNVYLTSDSKPDDGYEYSAYLNDYSIFRTEIEYDAKKQEWGYWDSYWDWGWQQRWNPVTPKTDANDDNSDHIQVQRRAKAGYIGLTAADYRDALVKSSETSISTAIDNLSASGATRASYGMEMANKVFANNELRKGSSRVVVFFTDGEPGQDGYDTNEAGRAIAQAYATKHTHDAKVFSVGMFDKTPSKNSVDFMNYVSSNYPDANASEPSYSWEDWTITSGDPDADKYYMTVKDGDLSTVFEKISGSILTSDVTAGKDTVLTDKLSKFFDFDGVTVENGTVTGVTVKKVAYQGNDKWAENGKDITSSVDVGLNGKTVTVSGFDYSAEENVVTDGTNGTNASGYKLVVTFNVKPDISCENWTDSKEYVTNDDKAALAKVGEKPFATVASPKAPVDTYQVTYEFDETAPDSATHPEDKRYYISGQKATVQPPEKSSVGEGSNTYTFNGWKNGEDDVEVGGKIDITRDVTLIGTWTMTVNKYTLSYNANDGKLESGKYTPAGQVEYKAQLTTPTETEVSKSGYTLEGWYSDAGLTDPAPATMPANDLTLYAKWTPNSGTKYTVNHHQQNLDNDNYTLTDTESDKTGTTGELTSATAKNYEGFTANSVEQKTIAADGSTVVDIYYDRNTYTVTYTDGVNDKTIFADEVHQSVKYGAPVPAYNNGTNPTRKNYTFAGWDPSVPVTMPADNLMFAAKWEKNPVGDGTFDFNDVVYGDGKVTPAITKTVKGNVGKNFTEAFYVTVKGADEKSAATMSAASYTGEAEVTYSDLKNIAFQFAENDKLTFRDGDNYTYTVREKIPGKTSRMSYDTTEYTLTIKVVLDEDSNTYQVKSWQFTPGNRECPDALNIVNTYRTYHPSTPSKPTLNTGDHYAYVMGYPDGTVRPNGSITRAEVSAILFRLLSDKTRDEYFTTESSFTDVKAGAWYNNSIATLEKAGVIVDTAKGGAFRPNEAITRAELAAMLAQFSDAKPVKGVKFSDVSAEHWAYEAIAIAAKMGWIEGYPDGTFRPDATITRAEMMTLVNRALERVPSDEDHLLSKRVMLTFPDCKSGDWFYIAVQEATNSHTYERAATEKNGDEQWTALRANRDWTLLEK